MGGMIRGLSPIVSPFTLEIRVDIVDGWRESLENKGSGVGQPVLFFMHSLFIYVCFLGLGHSGDPDDSEVSALGSHIISSALRTCS